MEEERKIIKVTASTWDTFKELSSRTRLDMMDLLASIAEQVQKQLDLLESDKRLLFMSDLYIDKNTANLPKTIIRLSDANSFGGLDSIPPRTSKRGFREFWI